MTAFQRIKLYIKYQSCWSEFGSGLNPDSMFLWIFINESLDKIVRHR
jgi:hypothetical protein